VVTTASQVCVCVCVFCCSRVCFRLMHCISGNCGGVRCCGERAARLRDHVPYTRMYAMFAHVLIFRSLLECCGYDRNNANIIRRSAHRICFCTRRRCQEALARCSPRLREELARDRKVLSVLAGNPRELARPEYARMSEHLNTRDGDSRESMKTVFQQA